MNRALPRDFLYSLALLALPLALSAQVRPDARWLTIKTEHFYVHFTPELEPLARRAAVQAESAYVELSRLLVKPRGKIDLVISDDVDFTNGWATPFPSNRIGIYANPPVFESSLRFTDDPTDVVLTHELSHLFHLDRVGGIWKFLQLPFGRVPYFFPNAWQPRWLVEGLAVHYESKLTGSGRIVGSDHHMIARTQAIAHRLPRLDQLSLANPHFPYGASTYIYGSLFVDHLARTHGDGAMRTFIESSSRQLIPMWLNPPARRAFNQKLVAEWRIFADSLVRTAPTSLYEPPLPGWRDLTVDGAYASFPRWLNDSTLVYTGTPGRETYGAYKLSLQPPAQRERIGRRNSRSPNTVLPDGTLLFSQLEYTSPYNLRSDLYVSPPGKGTRRLTRGARLAFPDARADGKIVAVQTIPGGTRIALLAAGKGVTPITSGSLDEHWNEPRWSPDGHHIAAVRWTRGGTSEVVVIDTTGRIVETLIRERTVNSAPSWSPDGRYVFFSSDRNGIANLYRAAFRAAFPDTLMIPDLQLMSDTQTGLFEPQPSPDGRLLAASVFKANGFHIGVAPLGDGRQSAPPIPTVAPREPSPPSSLRSPPSEKYSPWRSLLPRAWMPYFESALDSSSVRYGAFVTGSDVVERHAYQALLYVPSDNSGLTGWLFYRNATLGQPVIDLYVSQDWENRSCILDASQQNLCVGMLRRRIRDGTLALTFQRARARTFSYVSLGGGYEVRDYAADSAPLLPRIDPIYQRQYYYPRAIVSAGWSNTQYPLFAISPEDGISISTTFRTRWNRYHRDSVLQPGPEHTKMTNSLVASLSAFKSLDLPGFGHHVFALNGAGGVQDNRGTGYFEVGGVSGGSLGILPGYVLGEGRRTFGVRGFPPGSLFGIYAFKGSAEYRAPFWVPGRGLGTLPFFLDRTSITLFGDVGSAWCPGVYATRPAPSTSLCTQADSQSGFVFHEPNLIGSFGGELNVSAAILSWDAPFRYRLGYAVPAFGKSFVPGEHKPLLYFTVGSSF
jgi:hypothetical protein